MTGTTEPVTSTMVWRVVLVHVASLDQQRRRYRSIQTFSQQLITVDRIPIYASCSTTGCVKSSSGSPLSSSARSYLDAYKQHILRLVSEVADIETRLGPVLVWSACRIWRSRAWSPPTTRRKTTRASAFRPSRRGSESSSTYECLKGHLTSMLRLSTPSFWPLSFFWLCLAWCTSRVSVWQGVPGPLGPRRLHILDGDVQAGLGRKRHRFVGKTRGVGDRFLRLEEVFQRRNDGKGEGSRDVWKDFPALSTAMAG